jgi:hypothetical protein
MKSDRPEIAWPLARRISTHKSRTFVATTVKRGLLGATTISDDHAGMLREGMEVLVAYLASVRDG